MAMHRQLDRADVMFVAGETPTHYQHVALLMELGGAGRKAPDVAGVRAQCIERLGRVTKLRWKLHEVPLGIDRPYWVDDTAFACENHVRRIALPRPGGRRELGELVAELYCHPLDRSRPLWALWLIEGLQRNGIALLLEFHHCLMDGAGALRLLESLCDGGEPRGDRTTTPDAGSAGDVPDVATRSIRAVMNLARMPGSVSRAVYAALLPRIREQLAPDANPHAAVAAPATSFNGELSRDRAFAFGELPLAELKRLKTHFGVTINDLLLALVSGAVRDMLLGHAALPADSLRATLPVSLRDSADTDYGNRVTNATVTLATHLHDPLARLRAISEDSRAATSAAREGAAGVIELFQSLPPMLISGIMGSLPADRAPQLLGSNLVVSSVRGSEEPMHIAGARIEHLYPMSILTAGMGINVTCASHGETLDFGITVDPRLVREPWSLVAGLEAALAEYARLAASPPARPRNGARRSRTASGRASPRTGTAGRGRRGRARGDPDRSNH